MGLKPLPFVSFAFTNQTGSLYKDSIGFHKQYLETAHEIGDRRGQAYALSNQADVLWKLGQIPEARSHYEAAQAIFNDLGLEDLAEQCEKAMQALND